MVLSLLGFLGCLNKAAKRKFIARVQDVALYNMAPFKTRDSAKGTLV